VEEFILVKKRLPNNLDLCDIKVNDSVYTECRYFKHDDGTFMWVNNWSSIPSEHVSYWCLNPLHSDELTKEWLRSLKSLDEYPNIRKEDTVNTTHTFEV
jgi:hypothetical protein